MESHTKQSPIAIETVLDNCARKIVSLGLQMPVVFFLEIHKPLTTLLHTGTLLFEPLVSPLFGAERVHSFQHILADRKNIDRLIDLIQTHSVAQKST